MDTEAWPSHALRHGPSLMVKDLEFAWIGAAAAYWTLAEQSLEGVIWALGAPEDFAKRSVGFERKIAMAKAAIRSHPSQDVVGREIGHKLMTAGKLLSKRRNKIIHWVPSGQPAGMQFADLNFRNPGNPQIEVISLPDLQAFVSQVRDWAFDLQRYPMRLQPDPPSWLEFTSIKGP